MAQFVLLDQRRVPTPQDIARWLVAIAELGYTTVRSGALNESQVGALLPHGFRERQRLALLEHPLRRDTTQLVLASRAAGLHRLRDAAHSAAADVDRAAFTEPWALDAPGIADVCAATRRHRARCATVTGTGTGKLIAYAVSGRDGRLGFLQRLAVHPDHQRTGLGAVLVDDALRWAWRWRCERMLVNTDVANERALALYVRHGFVRLPTVLTVLERALP